MHGNPFGGRDAGIGEVSKIMFELLDSNHDGSLSREEFQKLTAAVEKAHQPHPQNHPSPGPQFNFRQPPGFGNGPQPLRKGPSDGHARDSKGPDRTH